MMVKQIMITLKVEEEGEGKEEEEAGGGGGGYVVEGRVAP